MLVDSIIPILVLMIMFFVGMRLVRALRDIDYSLTVTLPAHVMSFVDQQLGFRKQVLLLDDVVKNLQEIASRPQADGVAVEDPQEAYKVGLSDGATELAKYILEQLKEEK